MMSEEGQSNADPNELIILQKKLRKLEQEYCSIRQGLFDRTRSYYHQSIGSSAVTEDEIRRLINQCADIKHVYSIVQQELMSKRKTNNWSFSNSFVFGKCNTTSKK